MTRPSRTLVGYSTPSSLVRTCTSFVSLDSLASFSKSRPALVFSADVEEEGFSMILEGMMDALWEDSQIRDQSLVTFNGGIKIPLLRLLNRLGPWRY